MKDEIRLEASLPVITAFAFKIQAVHNTLLDLHGQILASTEDNALLEAEDRDALLRDFENVTFVIDQLLQVALLADYGDEIGRRKMFTLVRECICSLTCRWPMSVKLKRAVPQAT